MRHFNKHKVWLEDIASDRRLHRHKLTLAIAIILAGYKDQPSVAELAQQLHSNRRNVRRALDRLVETGWLQLEEDAA